MNLTDIESIIKTAIPDAIVHLADPRNDGVHLEALVISKVFEGLSLLEQQKIVMNALKASFDSELHALALRTYAPSKWETAKAKFQGKI